MFIFVNTDFIERNCFVDTLMLICYYSGNDKSQNLIIWYHFEMFGSEPIHNANVISVWLDLLP